MIGLETPGVQADGDVVHQRIGAGEIEVDQARELVAEEKDIVWKKISVDDACGNPRGQSRSSTSSSAATSDSILRSTLCARSRQPS